LGTINCGSKEGNREEELRSSGLLCSEYWQFLTDDSGHPINPIFKVQELLDSFEFLTLEDGTDRLSPIVGKKLPLLAP